MGAWTRRKIVKEYVDGTIDRDEADKLLARTVKAKQRRTDALDDADLIRNARGRKACIQAIRRRYLLGELDDRQGTKALTDLGLAGLTAIDFIGTWKCERISRRKEPTVKQLVDWLYWGIIDLNEMRRRLKNLGYSDDDAERILTSEALNTLKKQALERQRQADRNAREQERIERRNRRNNPPPGGGGGR